MPASDEFKLLSTTIGDAYLRVLRGCHRVGVRPTDKGSLQTKHRSINVHLHVKIYHLWASSLRHSCQLQSLLNAFKSCFCAIVSCLALVVVVELMVKSSSGEVLDTTHPPYLFLPPVPFWRVPVNLQEQDGNLQGAMGCLAGYLRVRLMGTCPGRYCIVIGSAVVTSARH